MNSSALASVSDNRCWKLRSDVVATVLNNGAVLLDLQSKFFFSANSSAWAIAEIFEFGATQGFVLGASQRWGAGAEHQPAINELIQQMVKEGLIQPVNEMASPNQGSGVKVWT